MDRITLDSDQQAALDTILAGGSMRVMGGPGTGKTALLIEALAALVERDGPDSVRVVTPNRQSATRLRDVLSLRVGLPTHGPLARSISSFAYDIVAAERGPSIPVRLISGGEQDSDMKSVLDGQLEDGTADYWPESLGAEVRSLREFRTQLRDLLSRARDAGLVGINADGYPSLDALRKRGKDHNVPEWVAAAGFLETYLKVSEQARPSQIDPAALVDEAADIIRTTDRDDAGARVLLVDDAQDFTVSQWRMLAEWNARRGPVIAFGDPNLATSGFRGATATLFTGTESFDALRWEPTLNLTVNHRQSGVMPHVLDIVTSALTPEREDANAPAAASVRDLPGFNLFSATAASPAAEFDVIARFVQEQSQNGVATGDIAIIVRSGSIAEGLVDYLTSKSIPAFAETTGSPLRDHPAVWSLLTIIGVGTGFTEFTPDVARQLLTGPFGRLSSLDYRRFRRALRLEAIKAEDFRLADELMMETLTVPGSFATSVTHSEKGVARLISLVSEVRANPTWQMDELLWLVWSKSGRAEVWAAESRGTGPIAARAHESLDAVLTLFSVAATALENAPAETPQVFLARMLDQSVPNDTLTPRGALGSVIVCTPAAALGREFDTVIVAGVNEGVWPNLRVRSALVKSNLLPYAVDRANVHTLDQRPGILADEIRLFHVALSRARQTVLVTAIAADDESPSALFRIIAGERDKKIDVDPMLPAANSRAQLFNPTAVFGSLAELVGQARHVLMADDSTDAERDQAARALKELANRGVRGADPADWLGLDLGTPRALNTDGVVRISPSGVEYFNDSPVDWFVSQAAGGSSGIDAAVGTLVHKAVELAPTGTADQLQATIEERWGELGFESQWQAAQWQRLTALMVEGIVGYIAKSTDEGFTPVANEGYINVTLSDPNDPTLNAIVSGSIDRVEIKESTARIIDLKTGKTDASATQHLQLASYQWALVRGAVTQLPAGTESAGAALLYPRIKPNDGALFTFKFQDPLTDEQVKAFEEMLISTAQAMRAESFEGPVDAERIGREINFDAQWVRIGEVGSDD
ncbi:MAG: PD-(D/E)XK nuclease family protein [Microbacteriaceae bacterium]